MKRHTSRETSKTLGSRNY